MGKGPKLLYIVELYQERSAFGTTHPLENGQQRLFLRREKRATFEVGAGSTLRPLGVSYHIAHAFTLRNATSVESLELLTARFSTSPRL